MKAVVATRDLIIYSPIFLVVALRRQGAASLVRLKRR